MGRGTPSKRPLAFTSLAPKLPAFNINYAMGGAVDDWTTWVDVRPQGKPKLTDDQIEDFLLVRAPFRTDALRTGSLCIVPMHMRLVHEHIVTGASLQFPCASDVLVAHEAVCEDCQSATCVPAQCASALGHNDKLHKEVRAVLEPALTHGEEQLPFGTLSYGLSSNFPCATRFHLQPGEVSVNFLMDSGAYRKSKFKLAEGTQCVLCKRTRCTEWEAAKAATSYTPLSSFISTSREHMLLGQTDLHLQARISIPISNKNSYYEVRISFPKGHTPRWVAKLVGPSFDTIGLTSGSSPCTGCPEGDCVHLHLYKELLKLFKARTLRYFTR